MPIFIANPQVLVKELHICGDISAEFFELSIKHCMKLIVVDSVIGEESEGFEISTKNSLRTLHLSDCELQCKLAGTNQLRLRSLALQDAEIDLNHVCVRRLQSLSTPDAFGAIVAQGK